jgi:hypothetical protein
MMSADERRLLVIIAAMVIGAPNTKPLSLEDRQFLSGLIGANDWDAIRGESIPLIRSIAHTKPN